MVIVIIVGRCKKKAKKLALYPDLCHGKKLICIENAKNENLRKYCGEGAFLGLFWALIGPLPAGHE